MSSKQNSKDVEKSVHYQEDCRLNDAAKMLMSFLEQESHRYVSTTELTKLLLEFEPSRKAQANMLPTKLLNLGYVTKTPNICGKNNRSAGWKISSLVRQTALTKNEVLLVRYKDLPTKPHDGKGFFYLVKKDSDGIHKLGITCNLKQRIIRVSFGCGSLVTPVFLCELPSYPKLEDALKKKFSHLSILGEWFNFCDEEIKFIKRLALEQPGCTIIDIPPPTPITVP